uniref:Beta-propeller domains of methanol dehydrogenase type n=1 Tax=uncultured bacterium Contig1578 TaxID=1393460 RepID=W0FQT1_9BACT|nr:beta-propeller domains of methanol dehydrogenase type [uncultured bacterium Contig1578]
MKRLCALLTALLMALALLAAVAETAGDGQGALAQAAGQASAAYTKQPLVVDGANLLTKSEREALEAKAQKLSLTYGLNVAIMTTNTLGGKTVELCAADYYDETYGDNVSGVMLAVCMGTRDLYILTTGTGIYMFTDYGIDYIGDDIADQLSNRRYAAAFDRYLDDVADFVEEAVTNTPYDVNHRYNETVPSVTDKVTGSLPVTGLLSALVTLLGVGGMKRSMNTVSRKHNARQYARAETLSMTRVADVFLYRTQKRVRMQQHNSGGGHGGGSHTFTSSHGVVHGGGGRKF